MKILKYIIALAIASSGTLAAKAVEVSINTSSVEDATAKIEASHNALLNIEDSATISGAEKSEKGVEARKEIISDAISLALAEIDAMENGLDKLPEFTKESPEGKLQSKFMAQLGAYSSYYNDKAEKLSKVTTTEEAKAFAREIIDYRTHTYNPSIEKMADFQLIFYTEDTINIANSRLTKMLSDIKKLEKLGLFKPGLVNTKVDQASELLGVARSKYERSKELVLEKEAVLEPVSETEPTEINQPETAIEPIVAEDETLEITDITLEAEVTPPTAKELIEASLTDVKLAYDIFIQISRDIRKSLGLK